MSLAKKILSSSSLLIGIKAFHRLAGLISIIVLARLLTPEDFAIVALTAIVVHFFDILSNVGSEQYIIQKKNISDIDLNTAWSIDLFMKTGLWLILLLTAHLAAVFFKQPELEFALYASSFILILNAAKNPGLLRLKQNFSYKKIFWLSIVQKIFSFSVAILIAIQYQSFWALILADLTASLVFTVGSYVIHPHRPKATFEKGKKQWHFSKWLLFKGVIGYTRAQIDTLMVSKFFPAAQLGQYYMARDIAMIPSHNLLTPATEPLLAAFKTVKDDTQQLSQKIKLSLFVISLISVPIATFIWFFPAPIIQVLLGEQWLEANDLLGMMSLLFLYSSFVQIPQQALIVMQRTKTLFFYDLFSLCFIFIILFSWLPDQLIDFALLRGVLGIFTTIALFVYINTLLSITTWRTLLLLSFITMISISSALLCQWLLEGLSLNNFYQLILTSTLFLLTYTGSLYLLLRWLNIKEFQQVISMFKISSKKQDQTE